MSASIRPSFIHRFLTNALNILYEVGMFLVIIAVIASVIFLWSTRAHASGDVVHLTWTLPTQYVDDTTLPPADLATITISWARPSSPLVIVATKTANASLLALDIPGMKCGDWQFTAVVTTTNTAKYPNSTSPPNNPVTYPTGIACTPKSVGLTAS